jgi:3-oxoacid CoA-transferase A subunit
MDKVRASAAEAVVDIPDGASLAVGGFGLSGIPAVLIQALHAQGTTGLEVVSNNCGVDGRGLGVLLADGRIARVTGSYVGENREFARQYLSGELEVELVPQGTLAERIRAGGFGLGGVLTPTGVGTIVEEGKRTIEIDGRTLLLELPLKADFALIAAKRADYYGSLEYALTARNFNPLMAMAATTVIAEAQDIVPVGVIPPDAVVTPNVVVDHLVAKEPRHG